VAWGVGFAVVEALALRVQHATLSEHVRTIFGFDDIGPAPRARRWAFVAFWIWFGIHICTGKSGCVSCISPPMPPA
jgi:hypothetical protein